MSMIQAHYFFYTDRQLSGDAAGVAVPDSLQPADLDRRGETSLRTDRN